MARLPPKQAQAIGRALSRLSPTLVRSLLHQCALVDQSIKGLAPGDPWHRLAIITDALAAGGYRAGRPIAS
jgi:DNA polymerase-3 subunit delta